MNPTKNHYWRWGIIPIPIIATIGAGGIFLTVFIFRLINNINSVLGVVIPLSVLFLSGLFGFIITIRYFVKKRLELNNLWSFAFSTGSYCSLIAGIVSLAMGELPGTDNLFYDIVISIMCLIAWAIMFTVFAAIYIQIANLILRKRFKTMNKLSIEVLDDNMPKPPRKRPLPPPSRRR